MSLILLLGAVFLNNNFSEFKKIPELVAHYEEHQKMDVRGISFFEFMRLHYFDLKHEQSDPAHHQKLPMQDNISKCKVDQSFFSFVFSPVTVQLNTDFSFLAFYPVMNCSTHSGSVFHPPSVLS